MTRRFLKKIKMCATRVPFFLRCPVRVTPGVSDALVSLVDFSASFAALTGQEIPAGDAPDSVNVLPALLGDTKAGRDQLVEHDFAFRENKKSLFFQPLADGVMVTQCPLEALFMVRIHVGQPLFLTTI